MKFLGQGLRSYSTNRTDRHTNRQMRPNINTATFTGGANKHSFLPIIYTVLPGYFNSQAAAADVVFCIFYYLVYAVTVCCLLVVVTVLNSCVSLCVLTAAVDQVVDCLDEIDCLTQPVHVDNSVVSQLLDDNRLISILEVCELYLCYKRLCLVRFWVPVT